MSGQRVAFPSFRMEAPIKPYDMRQLVAALEYRFQSLEEQDSVIPATSLDDDYINIFAPIEHTHEVTEISDFFDHVPTSIFDLTDVDGTAEPGDSLIWNGTEFVPGNLVSSIQLDDLNDVSIPTTTDGQILTFDKSSGVWVATDAPGGALVDSLLDLTDTDLETVPQARYDLLFNADGGEWRNTQGKLQWNNDAGYLQLAPRLGINWQDLTFTDSIELLVFKPGENSDFEGVINDTASTTLSTTYVDSENGLNLSQVDMVDGDEYLIMYQAIVNNELGTRGNACRLIASGVELTGSENIWENVQSQTDVSLNGEPYIYNGWLTASNSGTNIKFQHKRNSGPGTGAVRDVTSQALLLNLTTDRPNHVKARSTATTVGTSSWANTDTSVVLPAGDWLLFLGGKNNFSNSHCYYGITDGTTPYNDLMGRATPDPLDEISHGTIFYLDGFAGGTITMRVRTETFPVSVVYKSIIAIPLSDFEEAYATQDLNTTPTGLTSEFTPDAISTLNVPAVVEEGSLFLALGWFSHSWGGTGLTVGGEILANINGAGDVQVGWDTSKHHQHTLSGTFEGYPMMSDAPLTLTTGDEVDLTLSAFVGLPNPNTYEWLHPGLALLYLGNTTAQSFFVGDPASPTTIDGSEISLNASVDIDGGVVGRGAFDLRSTLDVTGLTQVHDFSIFDSTNVAKAAFTHDLIDFNTAFTATTDWNITGLDSMLFEKTLSLRWLNNAVSPIEMLAFEEVLTSGDLYWAETELLMFAEGADEDTTYTSDDLNARTATFNGTAKLDDAQTKFNATTSLLLDGNSDWVSYPYDAGLFFNTTDDQTVEVWIRRDAAITIKDKVILQANGVTGSQWPNFILSITTGHTINFSTYRVGSPNHEIVGTETIPINTWVHVAVCLTNADDTAYLFVAGVADGTDVDANAHNDTGGLFTIGHQTSATDDYFPGNIEGVRVTQGVARYIAPFTPPTAAFPDFAGSLTETFVVADPAHNTLIDGALITVDGPVSLLNKISATVTTVTATSYTAAGEHVILVDDDAAAAAVTITLPTAVTANTMYHIKKLGTTANVIVDGDGTEEIDGALTAVLTTQYESIMVISDGTAWHVI